MSTDAIGRLAAELRMLRSCFGGYRGETPTTPGGWSAAQYAYDTALVRAADMLGVSGTPDPEFVVGRRRLTDLERAMLEDGLAESGVEVRPPRALGSAERRVLSLPSAQPPWAQARANAPLALPVTTTRRRSARRSAQSSGGSDSDGPGGRAEAPQRRRRPVSDVRRLAGQAGELRQRLAEYRRSARTWPTKVAEWSADLDAYDETLLALADLVGIPSPLPPGARRRLLSEDRTALEQQLTEAGVDFPEASAGRG